MSLRLGLFNLLLRLSSHYGLSELHRLAPKFPYPAALDVCLDACRWMVEDQGSVRFHEKFKSETPVELSVFDDTPHRHQIFGFLPEAAIAREKLQSFLAAQT